ncbi:hypothetical protein QE152_g10137 [Popillia japonica]|uniref:Endonuclease/exonuclease/phosphatase domain-containing protein n=1 Tax=Popillia japonica TaxID=7064 RepID=A0AAW1LW12_POPJA
MNQKKKKRPMNSHLVMGTAKDSSLKGALQYNHLDSRRLDPQTSEFDSPSGDLNVFFTVLEDILQTATMKHNRKIVLLGDFNIDVMKEDNSNAKRMKDVIASFDLSITITEPTRVTKNTVSTIDNIFTNITEPTRVTKNTQCCGYGIIGSLCAEVTNYNAHFLRQGRKHIYRNDIKKTNNWITDEIKNKTTIKRQMYEDMKNDIIEANSYKTFCNALRIEIAAEKRKANSQYINNSQNRVKATWQLVRRITGYTKNKKSDITKIKIGDKINDDKHETLRYINTYLIDACKDMEKNLPDYCHIVNNIILEMKNTNSVGFDEIPVRLIKFCSMAFVRVLVPVINICLQTGVFPDKLKHAAVKLIHKKELSLTTPSHYMLTTHQS